MSLFERSRKDPAAGKLVGTFRATDEWLHVTVLPVAGHLLVYRGKDLAFKLLLPEAAATTSTVGLAVTHGILRIKSVKVPGEDEPDDE